MPLQLSLGDARAGVRGYKDATIAGGRRALLRLEQRRGDAMIAFEYHQRLGLIDADHQDRPGGAVLSE